MASKYGERGEAPEAREEAAEAPLLDTVAAAIKKMVAQAARSAATSPMTS